MKVLHISINDFMGAGLCAYRINKALQDKGIDSKMLVVYKHSQDSSVISFGTFRMTLNRIINRILYYLSIDISDENILYKLSRKSNTVYSMPLSHFDISNHPLVKDADIIHLHWINGLVDYPIFFKKMKKPIVWTLHDENLFCGISHYSNLMDEHNPYEIKYQQVKHDSLKSVNNISVVFLSKYFFDKFSNAKIISHAKKYIINNSVDCNHFNIIDKINARRLLSLKEDYIYFLFIAFDIAETRKGLNILIEAIEKLNNPIFRILAIGKCHNFYGHLLVKTFGLIDNAEKMSTIISASDYFVMPSMQEAFAQTPIEAMACGKPAIVFPVSGTEELITKENGVRCNGFSVNSLLDGIRQAMLIKYDSNAIRNDVVNRFSPMLIADKYIDVYNKTLIK